MALSIRKKRLSRSAGGDVVILLFLLAAASFMVLPMILIISNAFKPLSELFLFPPRLFVRNPTMKNFHDLMIMMAQSWVPFGRYLLNSLFIFVWINGSLCYLSPEIPRSEAVHDHGSTVADVFIRSNPDPKLCHDCVFGLGGFTKSGDYSGVGIIFRIVSDEEFYRQHDPGFAS
jgi:hypothetical protein